MPNLDNAGSIGFPSNDPNQFILDGATFTTAGSAVTSAKALKIGNNGATINANAAISWSEVITGKKLIKTGASSLNLYTSNPSLDTLVVNTGSVVLKTEEANTGAFKNIVLENGTLNTFDDAGTYSTSSWNIVAPEDKSGTITLDSRCDYTGKLTGAGTLTVRAPFVRTYIKGNWSAFTGKLNVTTDSDGGTFSISNTYGMANAEINATGGSSSAVLTVANESGSTFSVGAISGNAYSSLSGSWMIGAKNSNTTFEGTITGSGSLSKVGTGALSLSGVNTYTGATTVSGGRLQALNTLGSATGTGTVSVNNGAILGGKGFIGGNVAVNNGGTVEPGDHTSTSYASQIATLTFEKNLTLQSAATVSLNFRNRLGYPVDKIVVKGAFIANGNLILTRLDGAETLPVGTELQLFDFQGAVSGQFASVVLVSPGTGLAWDTGDLLTAGKIKVVEAPDGILSAESNTLQIYPNPATDFIQIVLPVSCAANAEILDLTGTVVLAGEVPSSGKLDVSCLSRGIYLLRITTSEGKIYVAKTVKK
jgi:autotransporter-associated beta strand protein